ncbi:MAG: hypothetical protein ACQKBY_09690 [Verrucomicrobiales bacterium]
MIPPLFHSLEHDAPFSNCLGCGRAFLDMVENYAITKAFRNGECVFEYALCQQCRLNLVAEFSEESKETMMNFLSDRVDLEARSTRLADEEEVEAWISHCVICESSASESPEHVIATAAHGEEMIFDPYPMMVCGSCEEELQQSLSKQTRERWDRFVSENFPGPPANALDPAPSLF